METIKLDINEHYEDEIEALEDNGYEQVDDTTYTKKGKKYKFVSVEKFNTWIYHIILEEAE